jgi:hypothetical protein
MSKTKKKQENSELIMYNYDRTQRMQLRLLILQQTGHSSVQLVAQGPSSVCQPWAYSVCIIMKKT